MVSETPTATAGQKIDAPMPPEAAAPPPPEPAAGDHAPAQAFKDLGHSFAELKDYLGYYVSAKLDAVKLTVRNVAIYAVLGVVGLIVGAGVLVTLGVLLVLGVAGLLNALINIGGWAGEHGLVPAAGYLLTSLAILGAMAWLVSSKLKALFNSSRDQTVDKYENRRRQQILNHGTDVHERAQAGPNP